MTIFVLILAFVVICLCCLRNMKTKQRYIMRVNNQTIIIL